VRAALPPLLWEIASNAKPEDLIVTDTSGSVIIATSHESGERPPQSKALRAAILDSP
jgi:hypothetical protein